VYEAELENQALYETERFVATESNGVPFNMLWIDLAAIGPSTPPVYPDGLTAMLAALHEDDPQGEPLIHPDAGLRGCRGDRAPKPPSAQDRDARAISQTQGGKTMPTDLAIAARSFFSARRIAVAGASRQASQPGRAIFQRFRAAGLDVVPVNPAATAIDGAACYANLAAIPGGVEAVAIVTPPAATLQVVRDCITLGVKRVWIHRAIGQGSAAPEAARLCRENGISLIDGACPLMYCPPVDFPHRCLRGMFGFFGRLPKPDGEW
jgi:uncharacterized protein